MSNNSVLVWELLPLWLTADLRTFILPTILMPWLYEFSLHAPIVKQLLLCFKWSSNCSIVTFFVLIFVCFGNICPYCLGVPTPITSNSKTFVYYHHITRAKFHSLLSFVCLGVVKIDNILYFCTMFLGIVAILFIIVLVRNWEYLIMAPIVLLIFPILPFISAYNIRNESPTLAKVLVILWGLVYFIVIILWF